MAGDRASWVAVALLLLLGVALAPPAVRARPVRGSVSFNVILCAFRNAGRPPAGYDFSFYQQSYLFMGLTKYFDEVSLGNLDFKGSKVGGWYLAPISYAHARNNSRQANWDACVGAARAKNFTPPSSQLLVIVTYPAIDLFSFPSEGAILPYYAPISALGHEMGHSLGLEHSFSNDGYKNSAPWAVMGEYGDPWDLMSYGNVYFAAGAEPYNQTGPGLAAYHMDRLGWLPINSMATFGKDGRPAATYTLRPLTSGGHGAPDGALRMVRVHTNPKDPFEHVTVELRSKSGINVGIPSDGQILIHHVKQMSLYDPLRTLYAPVLIYDLNNSPKQPARSYRVGPITITPLSSSGQSAQVKISTTGLLCKAKFVWRQAAAQDAACVTTEERTQVGLENRKSPRADSSGGCTNGLVPRRAVGGDPICVSQSRADQVAEDNANQRARRLATGLWGPNQCKPGMVWRMADKFDWVCVDPATQDLVRKQNAESASRQGAPSPNGQPRCKAGFVQRQAYPGDAVCVTQDEADQQAKLNSQASSNLLLAIA